MIGGYFTSIDGVHHGYLAAIDPTSGTPVSTWRSEGTGFPVLAIAVDSARVYAGGAGPGGRFVAYDTNLGRRLRVDGTDGNVQAIAVLDGVVYAGGHFTEFCGSTGHKTCAGVRRMKIMAADGPTGALEEWDPGANSTLGVWSLAADPASLSLFVGGDFTTIGGTRSRRVSPRNSTSRTSWREGVGMRTGIGRATIRCSLVAIAAATAAFGLPG